MSLTSHLQQFKLAKEGYKLCISLSTHPGRFGTTIHNAAYQALQLNYAYQAFSTDNIANAIADLRLFNIRGCSISMPYKESVTNYLDSIDSPAAEIRAVNTIVNDNGHLYGFNTDITGAVMSLKPHLLQPSENIMILGAGGVARAILSALSMLKQTNILLAVRDTEKYQSLARQFNVKLIPWANRYDDKEITMLINATSMGMNSDEIPIDIQHFDFLHTVMDVIVQETTLIKHAKQRNLNVINGFTMALYQAYEQFFLYTGREAPKEIMRQSALALLQTRS